MRAEKTLTNREKTMETKLIECQVIDVPKVGAAVRTFNKEFAVQLADSLKVDGQQNPIVVRTNPAVPARYILVSGRHRLYGMKQVLKEQFISATVIPDMDDAEAAIAADVENLWRSPLNKAQHASALKRWHTHWLAKMPAIEPKADVAKVAKAAVVAADGTDQNDRKSESDGALESVGSVEPASETQFNEAVAAVTGQSVASVRRSKAIAAAFTADQLEAFVQCATNQTDMLTIAKIKDEAKRAEVVNLIASGMEVKDALKEVLRDAAPSRYNCGGAEADAAKVAAKADKSPELSDDEWFEANCGEKSAMLGNSARFKADALLFRAHADLRHNYRVKGKKALAETKKGGVTGPFFNLVNRVLSISHPKDWLICPECFGKGEVASGARDEDVARFGPGYAAAKCPKCFGGGYLLKTETYL